MKIAILTLPLYSNYGGILQCYALQSVLKQMGHDVYVLSKPKYNLGYYPIWGAAIIKRIIKRYVLHKDIEILRSPYQIIRQNTDHFIKKYIRKAVYKKWNTKVADSFDAIIVGSDQIWRLECFSPIEDAFLAFAENANIKRIAYAASFGIDKCMYSQEQIDKCSALLNLFDVVTVREFSGVDICRNYFGVDAFQAIDPTLLLDCYDYNSLICDASTEEIDGDLFVYLLDDSLEKRKIVNYISNRYNYSPYFIFSREDKIELSLADRVQKPVEQWLRGFKEAKFIVTDSFHGCIFSIIYRKPFIAIGNIERGLTRFKSILDLFELNKRLVNDVFEQNSINEALLSRIDWGYIESVLSKKKTESISIFSLLEE